LCYCITPPPFLALRLVPLKTIRKEGRKEDEEKKSVCPPLPPKNHKNT